LAYLEFTSDVNKMVKDYILYSLIVARDKDLCLLETLVGIGGHQLT